MNDSVTRFWDKYIIKSEYYGINKALCGGVLYVLRIIFVPIKIIVLNPIRQAC